MNNPPDQPRDERHDSASSATPAEAAQKELGIPEEVINCGERRWLVVVAAVFVLMFAVIIYSAIHLGAAPPSNLETINPLTVDQPGSEFVESNLGSAVQADGTVVVRLVAQQYAFVPSNITVPADTPVVFRLTSPDVIHGLLVMGTNVNTMVVPGYVSDVKTRFARPGNYLMPCHEFCGPSHHDMWAHVHVVPKASFPFDARGDRRF